MMASNLRIRLTSRTSQDLFEIWNHINEDNSAAADRLIRKFHSLFDRLSNHPDIGRPRPELAEGLRSFPIASYIVFYRHDSTTVTIARVLHARRDLNAKTFGQ